MTINLLFITVTFKLNKITNDVMTNEALQYEKIKKIKEENYLKAVKNGYFW